MRKESVGPETEKRAPGANKFKIKSLWRPIAVVTLTVASSAVTSEVKSTPNLDYLSINNLREPSTALNTEKAFSSGTILLGQLKNTDQIEIPVSNDNTYNTEKEVDRASCDEIKETNYRSDSERSFYLQNCIKILEYTLNQKYSDQTAIITGYYCSQVPGYPIWDGGGYCGNTSSGTPPYEGSAACGSNWALGDKLEIEGVGPVTCTDRGFLAKNQVDVFEPTNKALYDRHLPSRANVKLIK